MDRFAASVVLAFILAASVAASAPPPPLMLNAAFGAPYTTLTDDGLLDRLLAEAGRRIGRRIDVQALPAERALLNANAGVEDGDAMRIAGLSRLYPHLDQVPEVLFEMELVAFAREPLPMDQGWASLEGLEVAVVTGWKIVEANTDPGNCTAVRTPELALDLVARGRADVAVLGRRYGLAVLDAEHHAALRPLAPPLATLPMFIYLHHRHAALVDPLAEALRAMKADGTYARILEGGPR